MKEELLKLAERVEALRGPDREVDEAIERAIDNYTAFKYYTLGDDDQSDYIPTRYTASLDAAMTLVPKGWAWSVLDRRTTGYSKPNGQCWTKEDRSTLHEDAAAPALALCAAALRALAKEK